MRRITVLLAAALLVLAIAGSPAAAEATLYLNGSGVVQGARFQNFVIAEPGQPPRGWLSITSGYRLHATATCAAVTERAATLGYRIDTGGNVGKGWVVSVQYPATPGTGGDVSYAGTVPVPPTTCPAPGDPPPDGFQLVGSGPITEGSSARGETPPAGPTSIVDVQAIGSAGSAEGFQAFADLNGADARGVTLTISREDTSTPVFAAPMTLDGSGLYAVAHVPALDRGSYVATYTLERGDGSTATTASGLRVYGARRIRDATEVNCRRLPRDRHACTVGLIYAVTATIRFRVRQGRKVVIEDRLRSRNGFGRLPGVSRLPTGSYLLELLRPVRAQPVFARVRFTLR
jgi:hypothetical protein